MSQRRYSLFDLFLFVAFCALVLAYVVPLVRRGDGSANYVQGLAFSGDSSTVAALFGDGKIRAWRASDQVLLASFDSAANSTQSRIAVSSDGSLAAVFTGFDPRRKPAGEIEIWDLENSRRIAAVPCLGDASLAFSPADSLLAVGNLDASIELYRCAKDGPPLLVRKLSAGNKAILNIQFAGPSDEQYAWQAPESPPIAFSADGKTMAAQSAEAVWFWNAETGEQGKPLAMRRELSNVRMAFSGDGKYVALEGAGELKGRGGPGLDVWDLAASRRTRGSPLHEGNYGSASARSLAFLPDARTLVSARKNEMAAWDVTTSQARSLQDQVARWPTVVAPCRGNRFAVDEYDPENEERKIALWDATTLERREVLWTPPGRSQPIPVLLGTAVLLLIWMFRSAKKLRRRCASCGRTFYLANRKDVQTDCEFCRVQAMPAGERKQEQSQERRKRRKFWWTCGVAILAGIIATVFKDRAPLWVAGAAVLAIPAGIFVILGVAIGFAVLKHRWRRRRLLRERNFVQLAEQSAGSPGETIRFGSVLVWSEPGTAAGGELEPQLAALAECVRMLTGQSPALEPWFRCFVFSNRVHFAKCLEGAGMTPINMSDVDSLYLPHPWYTALVDESQFRELGGRPLEVVRGLIANRFVDALGASQRRAWLSVGLSDVIANETNPDKLARLNRRMLAALAANRTLDAQKFFAKSPWIRFFNAFSVNEPSLFAKTAAEGDQYHSFMEFLCGAGSTSERQAAFQKFLADPRRRKRQDEALVASFGCSPKKLLDDWRRWVEQLGVGEHAAPPAEYAEVLASCSVATIKNEQAPLVERLRAIRRLGLEGFAVGVDALVDVLRRGPEELAAEAVWALEAISGRSLGADIARWEAWRESLPAEAVRLS